MAGGAMHSDVPVVQFKATPSKVTSLPSSSNLNLPVSATYTGTLRTSCSASNCSCHSGTGGRLETVDGREEKRASRSLYNLLFAHVPSQSEVENAIDALLNFMLGKSSSGSELNLLQQKLDCFDPRLFLSHGYGRVCDAFQLLQTDSSVKRLVISLASDKAIWDAILKNELVRKLLESSYTGLGVDKLAARVQWDSALTQKLMLAVDNGRLQSSNEEPDLVTSMLRWILDATKGKLVELIERFLSLVNDLFQPPGKEKPTKADNKQMEEKVRSSLLLSVVILLIVLVARAQNA